MRHEVAESVTLAAEMSEDAARYRAARAYSGLDQDELARELGVDRQTIIRREKGTQNAKRAEKLAVASICGVPPEFMLHGWRAVEGTLDRLERLEQRLGPDFDQFAAALLDLTAAVSGQPDTPAELAEERSHRGDEGDSQGGVPPARRSRRRQSG